MKEKTHNKPELKNNRKELRKNLTPAEAFLWKYLQNKKLEREFDISLLKIKNRQFDFYDKSKRFW